MLSGFAAPSFGPALSTAIIVAPDSYQVDNLVSDGSYKGIAIASNGGTHFQLDAADSWPRAAS